MSCQSCPANGGPCARCGGCIEPWQMKMAREMSERCGASQPAMEATDTCELPEGHAGYHVAHGARWSQGYTTPPAPPGLDFGAARAKVDGTGWKNTFEAELDRQHLAALADQKARIVAKLRETHIAANDFRGFNDAADFIEGSDL